jgi:hypothetical protein
MKPAASTIVNTGNLGGVTKTMTIMRDAMAHIMSVLTNLYSDAVLAVIREYSTNALDAHRESGYTGPIVVTVPSTLRPTFTVEDFGVGMSTDTILDLYSSYGASTKRGTNEQTGMLGLGSKSALAYSSQFTIRSRHAGVETTALVFLNDKGEGEIKIVDTKATDSTGTRIEIPVGPKDIKSFEKHAVNLFTYWKSADVTVKGVGIDSGYDSASWEWITDSIALAPKNSGDSDTYYSRYNPGKIVAVQGGVPYTVDVDSLDDHAKTLAKSLPVSEHDVVFIAPIGSLQFVPSREALYYTVNTNKALADLFDTYKRTVGKWITNKIATSKEKQDALRAFEKFAYLIPQGAPVKWNGQIVPASVECLCYSTSTTKRAGGTRHKKLPNLATMEAFDLIVYGASDTAITDKGSYAVRVNSSGHLGKGYALVDNYYGRRDSQQVLIIKGDLPEQFDWYGVKAVHVDTIKPATGRVKGQSQAKTEYHDREWEQVIANGYYGPRVKVDPTDDKVIYVSAKQRGEFRRIGDGWTVVIVPGNMQDRFAREFPLARTPREVRDSIVAQSVTLDEAASVYASGSFARLKSIDPAKILDPDLASVVSWIKNKPASVSASEALVAKYDWLGVSVEVKRSATPTLTTVSRRYGDYLTYLNGSQALDVANALYTYKYQGGTK